MKVTEENWYVTNDRGFTNDIYMRIDTLLNNHLGFILHQARLLFNNNGDITLRLDGSLISKSLDVIPLTYTAPILNAVNMVNKNRSEGFTARSKEDVLRAYIKNGTEILNRNEFYYVSEEDGSDSDELFDMYKNFNPKRKFLGFSDTNDNYWHKFFKQFKENNKGNINDEMKTKIINKSMYDISLYSKSFPVDAKVFKDDLNLYNLLYSSGFKQTNLFNTGLPVFYREYMGVKLQVNPYFIVIEKDNKLTYISVYESKVAKGYCKSVTTYAELLASFLKFNTPNEKNMFINKFKSVFRGKLK